MNTFHSERFYKTEEMEKKSAFFFLDVAAGPKRTMSKYVLMLTVAGVVSFHLMSPMLCPGMWSDFILVLCG